MHASLPDAESPTARTFAIQVKWDAPAVPVGRTWEWTTIACGPTKAMPWGWVREDVKAPLTSTLLDLEGPVHCVAIAYFADANRSYSWSNPGPVTWVDPWVGLGPVLAPQALEDRMQQCKPTSVRCVRNTLEQRPAVKTIQCLCLVQ